MLTVEQIEQNKQTFISILRSIKRDGANIEGMIYKLEHSDFFDAPASVQYHNSFKGGLCQHSLNVKVVEISVSPAVSIRVTLSCAKSFIFPSLLIL